MLERAVALRRPGPYQLQAAIAAAIAEDRPREEIVTLYDRLVEIDRSPVVRLNRAVAIALAGDVERGLALVDGVEGLAGYHFLHASRADLLRRLGRWDDAAISYRRALELATSETEARYLERRLAEVSQSQIDRLGRASSSQRSFELGGADERHDRAAET